MLNTKLNYEFVKTTQCICVAEEKQPTLKKNNTDCSPISSICAIEIEAILFLFMINCYKSSFQECITIAVLKIERIRGTSRHIVYFSYKKRWRSASPGQIVLGLPSPSPRVCTDGRTYADVRTKIFWINGLPNLLTHGAPRAPL